MAAIDLREDGYQGGQSLIDELVKSNLPAQAVLPNSREDPSDSELALVEAEDPRQFDAPGNRIPGRGDGPGGGELSEDSLTMYLREVGQARLLTAQEEINLAMEIERGRGAQERLREGPELSPEMGRLLEIQAQRGEDARLRMIESNLRLVVSIARKYTFASVPLADLVQDGNIGLMKAVDRFDYRRGFKFSTYATWWIKQSISRAIADRSRAIRVPVHVQEAYSKLGKLSTRMASETGVDPTAAELSAEAGVPEAKIQAVLDAYKVSISLESPVGDDGLTMGDLLEDARALDPVEAAHAAATRASIEEALARLPWRERRVLWLRFGFEDGRPRTLDEIGREVHLTRERVRQLESQALRRLRHPAVVEHLLGLLD